MATFDEFDSQTGDPTALVTAILGGSGLNIVPGSVTLRAGTFQEFDAGAQVEVTRQAVSFYDGSIAGLGIGPGILLTSGDGTPPDSNTIGSYGEALTIEGEQGDADLQAVADAAFSGAGDVRDVTALTFRFTVDNILVQKGVELDLIFASDEFPEFSNTSFVDVAAVFLNGTNIALFNNNANQPLSVIDENLAIGNFRANDVSGDIGNSPLVSLPIEYDGVSSLIKVVAPIQPGENTLKIVVGDTGDQIYDSGLFVANLKPSLTGGGGLLTTISGTAGNDELTGGDNNEFFDGGDGDDVINPGGGDDVVSAGPGNDTIFGGAGSNNIDGGDGFDVAIYGSNIADQPIVGVVGTTIQVGGNTDQLVNVEELQFADGSVAVSDVTGKDAIAKIYVGYFGRAADPDGLAFWLGELNAAEAQGRDRGEVLDDIANSFAISQEATDLFPFLVNPTQAQIESFVESVYLNLFNRLPGDEGRTFWGGEIQKELDAGRPVGSVILDIISGAQNTPEVLDASTVQNKAQVAHYYADSFLNAGADWTVGDDIDEARSIVDDVSADDATVDAAWAEIVGLVSSQSAALEAPLGA